MGLTYRLSKESKLQMKAEIQGGVNKDKPPIVAEYTKSKTKRNVHI